MYNQRKWNLYLKEILRSHVHCIIIYNSQDMQEPKVHQQMNEYRKKMIICIIIQS